MKSDIDIGPTFQFVQSFSLIGHELITGLEFALVLASTDQPACNGACGERSSGVEKQDVAHL